MGVKQLMIDGELAKDAEAIADVMGYDSVEYYVMDLIREDLRKKEEMLRLVENAEGITINE